MIINGKDFKIYDLDTNETILQRIAESMDTIPEFLYPKQEVVDGSYFYNANNGDVFDKIRSKYKFIEKFGDNEYLMKYYILYKLLTIDKNETFAILILSQNEGFEEAYIDRIAMEKDSLIKELRNKININKETVNNDIHNFTNLDQTEGVKYTSFFVEKVSKTILVTLKKPSTLLYIFDNIDFSESVFTIKLVVCKLNGRILYKSPPNIDPFLESIDFSYINNDNLWIVLNGLTLKDHSFLVTVEGDRVQDGTNQIKIEYDLVGKEDTNDDEFYVNLLSVLHLETNPYSIKKEKVKGAFNLSFFFIKEIFLDMLMNNTAFNSLYCDERDKTNKHVSSIRLYFTSKDTFISFSLAPIPNGTRCFISSIKKYHPSGTLIPVNPEVAIPSFRTFLSKIGSIYNCNETNILKFYKENGVKLVKITKFSKEATNQLIRLEPDMFPPLYSRKCAKAPRIIEVKPSANGDPSAEKYYTMPYNNRIYSCSHHLKHPYPGLIINTLPNSNKYPFLPCCFQTNQKHRRGGPYRHVFENEPLAKDKTDHDFYKTYKTLPPKSFGGLPSGIANVLTLGSSSVLERYGVSLEPSSFIDCVSHATQIKIPSREELITPEYIGISRQETYNISLEQLKEWIKDEKKYFDPKYMVSILEEYFNVSIFIFTRNIYDESDPHDIPDTGRLSLPNRSKIGEYVLRPLRPKSVFIYEHIESKSINPTCELIVLKNNQTHTAPAKPGPGTPVANRNHTTLFDSSSTEVKNARLLTELLIRSPGSRRGEPTGRESYTGQYVDPSGKARILFRGFRNRRSIPPSAPFFLPLVVLEPEKGKMDEYILVKKIAKIFFYFVLKSFLYNRSTLLTFKKDVCSIEKGFEYRSLFDSPYYSDYVSCFMKDDKIIFRSEALLLKILYNISLLNVRLSPKAKDKLASEELFPLYENINDFKTSDKYIIYFHNPNKTSYKALFNTLEFVPKGEIVIFGNNYIKNGIMFIAKSIDYLSIKSGIVYLYNGSEFDILEVAQSSSNAEEGQLSSGSYVIYRLMKEIMCLSLEMTLEVL